MESASLADTRSLAKGHNNQITGDDKKSFDKQKVLDPIAVVEISLRFPEDAISEDSFWDLMADQRCASNKFPNERRIFCGFDGAFFSMAPQEAASLDPQQRGLLDMTYLALENAGIPIDSVRDSKTSVHVACFTTDFMSLIFRDPNQIGKYSAQQGIVAGSNLILSPELNIAFSEMGVLSPDGRCYSFDDRANGYGRGEVIAVLVLKTLSKAIEDGDNIRALIRSTGTNQDGRTTGGLTQPSQESQSRLIDETYLKAGLSKSLTRFIEAHGTGTPIGDPIEAMAIGDSFRRYRSSHEPLLVGAVKSNIGHLEGASGLASLTKTIQFPSKNIPWPSNGIRRASVNSFGMGGTNSHVVLDDVHHYLQAHCINANHRTVSSPPSIEEATAQKELLDTLIDSYTSHFANLADVESSKSDYLNDLAFTLNNRRSVLLWKSYVVANSIEQLSSLSDIASKPMQSPIPKPNLAFLFTGQGAQWFGMSRELLIYPAFRESILKSEYYLFELSCPWKLTVELAKSQEDSRVNEPEFSQPLCTAVQIALVDLLRVFGVLPSVVVGHSSGEIASA
ncbi:hypothetical protein BCON_0238g00010 [Botryotinia convoluta]|uniref:Ketosynthase family 3 (KS3) domain-containing protein n=1 Tax=Botryotinia convoluta TaxID=54673 RepID=A0A4Z1HHY3_9HELO|nr:hypothetical protein BCON_0238g00010 [Botryotinia convoluta]